jgi:hypothetical protein
MGVIRGGYRPVSGRRRRRKRFTNAEITDLFIAKALFGARSPVVTIMGFKMIGRGG